MTEDQVMIKLLRRQLIETERLCIALYIALVRAGLRLSPDVEGQLRAMQSRRKTQNAPSR
jgi:hypothetical protein